MLPFTLEKSHDGRKNKELLRQIFAEPYDMKQLVNETQQLFEQVVSKKMATIPYKPQTLSIPLSQKILEKLFRFSAKKTAVSEPSRVAADSSGNVYPDWKDKLDQEFTQFTNQIKQEVNVADFGAVGDGKTDCTNAFKKALGSGGIRVIVPEGVFLTKGIKLPSSTILTGAGKGRTTIKLHDHADKGSRLITNANHQRGNHHLMVQGLNLDWNVERLSDVEKTSTGGHHSSCLTFANVAYAWVKDIEAINPGLHCFDITSSKYNYAGDGYRARGGSRYVWLDHLNGYGFGDDGITTHHSDYILITDSHMCNPSGRAHQKGFSNSNGIEIDDGSQNVVLVNNSTARCFGSVEIKAHQNSSAASSIQIFGHISLNDNRSYNFRHIGHHTLTDLESKTAHNIIAANLASIAPIFCDLYEGSKPRGLVISAYKNVVLNHCLFIGNPDYDFKGSPVAAIQYRARNVILNRISFKNFHQAGPAIRIFGGANRADSVLIQNIESYSGQKAVAIGEGIQDIKLVNVVEKR